MAFIMDHTDATGTNHPASYWIPTAINSDKIAKRVTAVFGGFHDKASRQANLKPIAQKGYQITGASYDQYFSPNNLESLNVMGQLYAMASATNDTTVTNADGTKTVQSFFATATPDTAE